MQENKDYFIISTNFEKIYKGDKRYDILKQAFEDAFGDNENKKGEENEKKHDNSNNTNNLLCFKSYR